jgi:hypothetical protein
VGLDLFDQSSFHHADGDLPPAPARSLQTNKTPAKVRTKEYRPKKARRVSVIRRCVHHFHLLVPAPRR